MNIYDYGIAQQPMGHDAIQWVILVETFPMSEDEDQEQEQEEEEEQERVQI